MVSVPRESFEGDEGRVPPEEWEQKRAVDLSLLRACSIGLPRLIVQLLGHGANPNAMMLPWDNKDNTFWIPDRCNAFCRVAVEVMNDGRGLERAGDFCRFWVCARELLRAGGDPCRFLNLLKKTPVDRWVDHRDPRNNPEEAKRDPTPFCFPSRPIRLQPRAMRLRLLMRLCAEPSLKRRRRQDGSGDGSQRETETKKDETIFARLCSIASALCQRDEEYNRKHLGSLAFPEREMEAGGVSGFDFMGAVW
eukprot:Cvel_21931.t1-p1 / transcript=Cvel_21931.t1 / gene=Cvel_21931 / organism=Chromera_velia_CCMP2878 / gene_product=hypothetical protein / transcript_product=hypothetical protein / location=Cvel_scaffold2104:1-747(-) / protein_length=249 / sequence_SO=supercontig / SO=protein_coding / is_pseudo=false